jgi:hypothetical protein
MKMRSPLEFPREPQKGPPDSLKELLDERWHEYLQLCAKNHLQDENHAVQLRLYAAMRKLSEAVEDCTVPDAIIEIGSNFIGCEQMAILAMQRGTKNDINLLRFANFQNDQIEELQSGAPVIIRSVGLMRKQIEKLQSHARKLIEEVPEGEIYIRDNADSSNELLSLLKVTALVPLWQNRVTKGAIVFFDLLPQRDALNAEDRALLKLLAVYAGPCLFKC